MLLSDGNSVIWVGPCPALVMRANSWQDLAAVEEHLKKLKDHRCSKDYESTFHVL